MNFLFCPEVARSGSLDCLVLSPRDDVSCSSPPDCALGWLTMIPVSCGCDAAVALSACDPGSEGCSRHSRLSIEIDMCTSEPQERIGMITTKAVGLTYEALMYSVN